MPPNQLRKLLLALILAAVAETLPKPHHLTWKSPHVVERAISDDTTSNRVDKFNDANLPALDNLVSRPLEWNPEQIESNSTHACDETNAPGRYMVYCSGRLLQAVMATRLHADSKTFVDRPMKVNQTGKTIMEEFDKRFPQPVAEMTIEEVKDFVDEHFDVEGEELMKCNLTDWQPHPGRIAKIMDGSLRKFALDLHSIWKSLCRQVKPEVDQDPQRFSLIYVPNQFIVPGGRFRESYYWDAYWIMKGLLVSGMTETVNGMIRNFAHIVDTYGFIPNGGRVYYLQRSQPPMFAPMVYDYYQQTLDIEFVKEMLPIIEKETAFWQNNRNVTVRIGEEDINMFQYRTPLTAPRPESYREDMTSAQSIPTIDAKQSFFRHLASAAESGWDFSTRWLKDYTELTSIETINIVPVDLNAFICYNMNILAHLHAEVGNLQKENKWTETYISFRDAFKKVFYTPKDKGWYDYNLRTREHDTSFYPSMAVPLFTQCYDPLSTSLADDLYTKMDEMGAFQYAGGVPTSLRMESHQQWDFPNGWSPLNHMVIEGLRKSANPRAQQKAFQLAEKWVLSNLRVFQQDKVMWEKYDVVAAKPRTGKGGEYSVQAGFGWTNGVILDLLSTYGDRMRFPDIHPPIIPVNKLFRNDIQLGQHHDAVVKSSSTQRGGIAFTIISIIIAFSIHY